jgi:hypothetical protein
MMKINRGELDRHITGNYGEDQFDDDTLEAEFDKLVRYVRAFERVVGIEEASCLINDNAEVTEAYRALSDETRAAIEATAQS